MEYLFILYCSINHNRRSLILPSCSKYFYNVSTKSSRTTVSPHVMRIQGLGTEKIILQTVNLHLLSCLSHRTFHMEHLSVRHSQNQTSTSPLRFISDGEHSLKLANFHCRKIAVLKLLQYSMDILEKVSNDLQIYHVS